MELVSYKNPILTTPCAEFDMSDPPMDPIELAQDLVKFMRDNNGIGLAAPQVGIPYRVFCIRSDPNKVFFNPRLVYKSEDLVEIFEGCLSLPGLMMKVKRPAHVRIRYTQPNGETLTETFTGMTARQVQHEYDHIDGILFTSRVSRLRLERAIAKAKKLGYNYNMGDLINAKGT